VLLYVSKMLKKQQKCKLYVMMMMLDCEKKKRERRSEVVMYLSYVSAQN